MTCDGHEGIQAVFEQRNRIGGDLAFVAFHVLELDGRSVMREPWTQRRKRLEDLLVGQPVERLSLAPARPRRKTRPRSGRRGSHGR